MKRRKILNHFWFFVLILIGNSYIFDIEASKTKDCLLEVLNVHHQVRKLSLPEIEDQFQKSDKLIFFEGLKNKGKNNLPLPIGEFQPGNTYTAMVINDQLVLGKNIVGAFVPHEVGGPGSHVTLFDYFMNYMSSNHQYWIGNSGAIGFGEDGTIYISGYHYKENNFKAAEKMEKIIKKICPSCPTRITGGKLEEFGPLK